MQRLLTSRIDQSWGDDMNLAEKMLHILYYCAELDPIARKFHDSLKGYHVLVKEAAKETNILCGPDELVPKSSSLLFLTSAPGDTKYHTAAYELFNLVRKPFGDDRVRPERREVLLRDLAINHEECTLGVHREWVAEFEVADEDKTHRTSFEAFSTLSNMPGEFSGSDKPSHWKGSQSSSAYLEGATTLEFMPVVE